MKKIILLIILLITSDLKSQNLDLAGKDFLIDDLHSYLGFKIKYFGFSPVRGRFDKFDGTLLYSPSNIGQTSLSVYIDVSSINTGNNRRDNDLTKEDSWFDAKAFPHIIFKSKKIIEKNDGSFDMVGNLTIKETTKEVVLPFEKPTDLSRDWAGNEQIDFAAKLKINRQDFGVYGGSFWSSLMENGLTQLSDTVEIEIEIHCRRPDYSKRYQDAEAEDIRKVILGVFKDEGDDIGLSALKGLAKSKDDKLTSGALSTIGNTLLEWNRVSAAIKVYALKMDLFPERFKTNNQLGITYMKMKELENAKKHFMQTLKSEPSNSRAHEYLRWLKRMEI